MLTQVTVTTPKVTTSPLPFTEGKPFTDYIQIHSIDGLGPVAASINTSQYGSIRGEFYNGSFTGKRNIVLTVGFNPNWRNQTIEKLRAILYQYFTPEMQVTLTFESTHMETVAIVGYVESFEVSMFSIEPEMTISIICPKPEFVGVSANVIPGTTKDSGDPTFTAIDYKGTYDTGFVLTVTPATGVADSIGDVRIINQTPATSLFDIVADITTVQGVSISTVESDKFAYKFPLPSGDPVNILGKVVPGSVWLSLVQGLNNIRVNTDTPGHTWTLQYYARYGGL